MNARLLGFRPTFGRADVGGSRTVTRYGCTGCCAFASLRSTDDMTKRKLSRDSRGTGTEIILKHGRKGDLGVRESIWGFADHEWKCKRRMLRNSRTKQADIGYHSLFVHSYHRNSQTSITVLAKKKKPSKSNPAPTCSMIHPLPYTPTKPLRR